MRALTDDAGQVLNEYSYDSYGNIETEVEALSQRYRYTGMEWDAATGLYHYRARAYDAELGRFLQEDPIGFNSGDLNFFRHVESNPQNFTDPTGLAGAGECGGKAEASFQKNNYFYAVGRRIACSFSAISGVMAIFIPTTSASAKVISGVLEVY